MKVRILVDLLASGALAGCGAETVGAAATSAAIKKQEAARGSERRSALRQEALSRRLAFSAR